LNIMWLMFGDGDMLLGSSPATDAPASASAELDGAIQGQRAISFDESDTHPQQPSTYNPAASVRRMATEATVTETIQNIVRGHAAHRGGSGPADAGRRVVNLMVFYNDGTFEQFGPSR